MKKIYHTDDNDNNLLQEPEVAYQTNFTQHNTSKVAYVNPVRRAISLLGISDQPGIKGLNNKTDFINYVREGIPKISLDNLMEVTGFSATEMADILHTTDRTLRRYTSTQKLNPEQSERLIEMALLYTRGEEVFDTLEQFKIWMDTPVLAIGNKKPKTFLDTSIGIELLMTELGRIEHGIFA